MRSTALMMTAIGTVLVPAAQASADSVSEAVVNFYLGCISRAPEMDGTDLIFQGAGYTEPMPDVANGQGWIIPGHGGAAVVLTVPGPEGRENRRCMVIVNGQRVEETTSKFMDLLRKTEQPFSWTMNKDGGSAFGLAGRFEERYLVGIDLSLDQKTTVIIFSPR